MDEDTLRALERTLSHCLWRCRQLTGRTYRSIQILQRQYEARNASDRGGSWFSMNWHLYKKLQSEVQRGAKSLVDSISDARGHSHDVISFVEQSNLPDHPCQIQFREYDFLTATAATLPICECVLDDCSCIDWAEQELTGEEKHEICLELLEQWRDVPEELFRGLQQAIELEFLRATAALEARSETSSKAQDTEADSQSPAAKTSGRVRDAQKQKVRLKRIMKLYHQQLTYEEIGADPQVQLAPRTVRDIIRKELNKDR